MNDVAAASEIYQFRAVLRDTSPHLWRRLRVNSNITAADFHRVLEVALGWSGSGPYRFLIRGRIHSPGGQDDVDQLRRAERLEEKLGEERQIFFDEAPPNSPVPQAPLTVGLDGGYLHQYEPQAARKAGLKSSWARACRPKGPPNVLPSSMPTMTNRSGNGLKFCDRQA